MGHTLTQIRGVFVYSREVDFRLATRLEPQFCCWGEGKGLSERARGCRQKRKVSESEYSTKVDRTAIRIRPYFEFFFEVWKVT